MKLIKINFGQFTRILCSLFVTAFFITLLGCSTSSKKSSSTSSSKEDLNLQHLNSDSGEPEKIQGLASWYGRRFHKRRTASGERFNMYALTAAHRTLPFGTIVRVRSLKSNRSVYVKINDRGPHHRKRLIDVSYQAGRELGILNEGVVAVEIEIHPVVKSAQLTQLNHKELIDVADGVRSKYISPQHY
jgi:rare lipoprotein A